MTTASGARRPSMDFTEPLWHDTNAKGGHPMNRLVILVVASLLLSGCISDAPIKPKPKVYQPKNAFRVEGSPIVLLGTVQSVLPSPGGLSIVTSFFQGVKYRVEKVESGQISRGNVTVYHMLVGPPMTEKDSPEL